MNITCPSCGNHHKFLIPLWVRATFQFNEDGTISVLHLKPLESLEEKLASQGKTSVALSCADCGADARIVFNEFEQSDKEQQELKTLEGIRL